MHHQDLDFTTHSAWDARPQDPAPVDEPGSGAGEPTLAPTADPAAAAFESQIVSHHGFPMESPHDQQIDAHHGFPLASPHEHRPDLQHGHRDPSALDHAHHAGSSVDQAHHAHSYDHHDHSFAFASAVPGDAGADPLTAEPGGAVDLHSVAITSDHGYDPWHLQGEEMTCAIAAQRGILESHLGHAVSEEDLRDLAVREHWYEPGAGTHGADVGRLLEHFGIPVERGYGCHLTTLYSALQEHRSVLVGVNAEGLRPAHGSASPGAATPGIQPHILQVIGMSFDDAGRISLHLNDSASPAGGDTAIDARSFLDAWADCGNFAAITGE